MTMEDVGWSVMKGGLSTLLAVVLLAFSQSKAFQVGAWRWGRFTGSALTLAASVARLPLLPVL